MIHEAEWNPSCFPIDAPSFCCRQQQKIVYLGEISICDLKIELVQDLPYIRFALLLF